MDLVSAYTQYSSGVTLARVQMAAAKKVLDSQRQGGAAALKLLESAARVGMQRGDELVASVTGLGSQIDLYA